MWTLPSRARLIAALQHLFAAPPAALENWHAAVAEFKEMVPALGRRPRGVDNRTARDERAVCGGFYGLLRTVSGCNQSEPLCSCG